MMVLWDLPKSAVIGGKSYDLHCDFRDILGIFAYFDDPELPDFIKWRIGLRLFYGAEIPPEHREAAMVYMADFIRMGQAERNVPQLICWQHDAPVIIGEVNRVAGREIRELPFVHWWTFLSWFYGVGEGQLSFLVSLRAKLRRGEKLEAWESAYYRENRERVDIPKKYTEEELRQRQILLALLDGQKEQVK